MTEAQKSPFEGMPKTARFFEYKGQVGALINPDGKFINDPKAPGQLGSVISTNEVQMPKEVKEVIRNAGREGGSFAPLMLTDHAGAATEEHGKSSIGVMGLGFVHLGVNNCKIGRTCTLRTLDDCEEVPNDPPDTYKSFIDNL